jgi:hypothetical protein
MRDLNTFMRLCLISAVFALAARILPAVLNIGRNYLRWIKAQGLRPLDLENGLESWSNFNVIGRVAIPAWTLIIVSSLLFLLLLGIMVFSNFGSEPGALQNTWSKLELQCPHPPALDGVS